MPHLLFGRSLGAQSGRSCASATNRFTLEKRGTSTKRCPDKPKGPPRAVCRPRRGQRRRRRPAQCRGIDSLGKHPATGSCEWLFLCATDSRSSLRRLRHRNRVAKPACPPENVPSIEHPLGAEMCARGDVSILDYDGSFKQEARG